MREPDLFDWVPDQAANLPSIEGRSRDGGANQHSSNETPSIGCQLVPFPLHLRIGKVRTVARTLAARRTEAGRARYWTRTVGELSAELRRHGANAAEIEQQVAAFTDAVARNAGPTLAVVRQ